MIGDWDGRVQRLGREAFTARTNDRAQLRSATLLRVIRDDETPMPSFTFDAGELAGAAQLARIGELSRSRCGIRRNLKYRYHCGPNCMLRRLTQRHSTRAAGWRQGSGSTK